MKEKVFAAAIGGLFYWVFILTFRDNWPADYPPVWLSALVLTVFLALLARGAINDRRRDRALARLLRTLTLRYGTGRIGSYRLIPRSQAMRTRHALTISLPPKMHAEFERVRKAEQRSASELVREALRLYFNPELAARIARLPVYVPTKRELQEIEKGRRSKDYLTIDELFSRDLARPRRAARPKSRRARSEA